MIDRRQIVVDEVMLGLLPCRAQIGGYDSEVLIAMKTFIGEGGDRDWRTKKFQI